jgi:hypothetical protein
MKRFTLLFVLVCFCCSSLVAAPFTDVKSTHWAMSALDKLSKNGILVGYPDGSFKGTNTVTRFDVAVATAKMLAHVEQMMESGLGTNLVTKDDLQTLEKLTVEFADELALLGVKVTSLEDDMQVVKEDVSVLKADVNEIKDYVEKGGFEKVKLSGDILVRHTSIIHKNDWALNPLTNTARAGNSNNVFSEMQLRLKFDAQVDENTTVTARWVISNQSSPSVSGTAASNRNGIFGIGGIGSNTKVADSFVNYAYLKSKNFMKSNGTLILGRTYYYTGHLMVMADYIDAVRYKKTYGRVNFEFQSVYDRHTGNYKDDAAVDFRNVWNVNMKADFQGHKPYLNLYWQDDSSLINRRYGALATATRTLGNSTIVAGQQKEDSRWDAEFGSRGPLGKCGHFSYDLGLVYTDYKAELTKTAAIPNYIQPEMQGWMTHGAINWDQKKDWKAKVSYTSGDDENVGPYAILNNLRYLGIPETPYEDISRGNTWFNNGLTNMYDLKLQVEYKPQGTKHYFRVAGDWLDELKDTVSNDIAKLEAGHTTGAVPAGFNKTNTVYDRFNSLMIADPKAMVLTLEYRYQLSKAMHLRVCYTNFDISGDAQKLNGPTPKISGGRGFNNDYDYNLFWAELYSKF